MDESGKSAFDYGALSLEGTVWTIEFAGVVRHVSSLKRLEYLGRLLAEPGKAIAATAIEAPGDADPGRSEKARLNVTRAIRATIARIAEAHPDLAEHLLATVRTGKFCSYRPDPRVPIRWQISKGSSR